jgi:hypothetical protein
VLRHAASIGDLVATYLAMLLILAPPSSSGTPGQCAARMSYDLRPSSMPSARSNTSLMTRPKPSSTCGASHPPYRKPSESSSPGPPGACMTPSSDTNVETTSLLAICHSFSR